MTSVDNDSFPQPAERSETAAAVNPVIGWLTNISAILRSGAPWQPELATAR